MLAVVEHEQEFLRAQEVEHALFRCLAHTGLDAERGGDVLGDGVRLTDAGQLAEPRTVAVAGEDLRGDLDGEASLADTADTGERQDARLAEGTTDDLELGRATDEGRGLHGQVAGKGVERAERREASFQIGMADLQHAFGSLEVAQPVLTEVEERHAVERVRRELGRRVRHDDLSPVGH